MPFDILTVSITLELLHNDGLMAVLKLADSSPRLSHDGLLDLTFRFLDELPKPLVFSYANLRRSCAGLQSACVVVSLCQ